MLANSGFEVDSNNDGQPDGWDFAWEFTHSGDDPKVQKKQKPDYGLDEKVVHSGKRSVRIAVSRREDDGLYRQVVTRLVPGTKLYRLSAWVKTEGVANGDARVIAAYYGSAPGSKAPAEKKWLAADYNAIRVSKDSDWQFLCSLLEPPPGTADIRIALWVNFNYAGPCKAWFDDLSLTATDLQEAPPLAHL
ncbi:MAG: hypothetical protein FJ278_03590, partial [Planctomycetes bacterium]|nr:hypothetical protein [Planctomycetota bacterium]